MTRRERRALLGAAIVLAAVCAALFARAVLAQRAADLSRGEARAALLPTRQPPRSDGAARGMLEWSGAIDQMRFWQALQRFHVVSARAKTAAQYTLVPLGLIAELDAAEASLKRAAAEAGSPRRRSRLDDMLGLAYVYDATLHRGQEPIEPQLEAKAIVAFRHAALLDSQDDDAKTNLELLLRRQLRRKRRQQAERQGPLPDEARVQNLLQDAAGLPAQNGSVGRHFSGGY